MASRMKEEERNEKIIRGLLKLPQNRRCINCNNLGPQYVCTNFWTFICTNCSGLHREFCHRVKSISMSKFTTQEVNALQEGGNERAKEIYFKEWDPQRHFLPDSSNIDRLRDFIKHAYVDRRFSGERNTERLSQGKADRGDSNESGRGDSYLGDSRSPPYDDRSSERLGNGGRNGDRNIRYIYGERSPGYDHGGNKRSPQRFEVVDDRVRDDRYGIRRFEERRLPDVAAKPEGSSPSRLKDVSSPPVVRPVRDILGDDIPQLHVGDIPKSQNTGVPDSSASTQRSSSSSSMGSTDGNSVQLKRVNLGSLIDFTAEPEHNVTAEPQQRIPQQITSQHSNGGDWASFDNAGQQKASQLAANVGTLESALTQLSTSGPAPTSQAVTQPTSGIAASARTNDVGQWATTQHHQTSLFPAAHRQPTNQVLNAPIVAGQSWGPLAVPGTHGPLPNSGGQFPQVTSRSLQETSAGVSLQQASVEAKPIGRKELPADLFAALYPPAPVAVQGWQRGPYPGIGYGMQYPVAMPQVVFPNPSKSTNPFDFGGEPALTHAPTFPSMPSLQGPVPHMPGPSPLVRSSSFGNPSPQWVQPQQSSFPPAMPQGLYMMHQVPGNMPQQQQQFPGNMPQQQNNNMIMGQQSTGGPGTPATPSKYHVQNTSNTFGSNGGNPFG